MLEEEVPFSFVAKGDITHNSSLTTICSFIFAESSHDKDMNSQI